MNRANSKYVVNHFLTDIKNKKSKLNHAEKCFDIIWVGWNQSQL